MKLDNIFAAIIAVLLAMLTLYGLVVVVYGVILKALGVECAG
jgi:hypothetical protein